MEVETRKNECCRLEVTNLAKEIGKLKAKNAWLEEKFGNTEKELAEEKKKVLELEKNQIQATQQRKINEGRIIVLEKSDLYGEEERKKKNENRITTLEANFEKVSRNIQVVKDKQEVLLN